MSNVEVRRFWARRFWAEKAQLVRQIYPKGKDLVLRRNVPHPLDGGFEASSGADVGQVADYRADINGVHFHVHQFRNGSFGIHWDKCRPDELCHYIDDFPIIPAIVTTVATVAVGVGVVALIASLFGDG